MAIGPESQVLGLSRSQLYRLVRAHTLDDEPADHGSLRNGHLREAVIFLSEYAFSDEKTPSSCRSARPSTTRCNLLVGARVPWTRNCNLLVGARILRQENATFSSDHASSVEKMSSSEQRRDAARPDWLIMQSGTMEAERPCYSASDGLDDSSVALHVQDRTIWL